MAAFKDRPYPRPGRTDAREPNSRSLGIAFRTIEEELEHLKKTALSMADHAHCEYAEGLAENLKAVVRGIIKTRKYQKEQSLFG